MKGTITIKTGYLGLIILIASILMLSAFSCETSQTDATISGAVAAAQKWGALPNITNYYEYYQEKEIYEARDNPKLVMNAYLYSNVTGELTCFGKVAGYGLPYSTEWSQPNGSGTQGSVPEPNGLYPSQNTNADWVRVISPDGKQHVTFAEPELIITDQDYPCKKLSAN